MKKLLFLLMLFPVLGMAQDYRSFYLVQDTLNGGANTILNKAYAASQLDTCQPILADKYREVWLTLQSTDTASLHVAMLQSANGITWTTVGSSIDSLSVAAATGGIKTVNLKSFVGNAYTRFVFSQTAYRVPVAGTHLYTAKITLIK